MFKVVIVDDEPYVCSLIRKLVEWEKLELTCVGEADSSRAAMEKIREFKPDIVLTDIRMPGIDGLEMISKVKEEFPDLFFVVFSGHKDFDYACSAIKYGVEDYLLKPLNQKKINQVLGRIVSKLTQQREEKKENIKKNEQLEFSLERLKEMFVRHLLEERLEFDSIEIINRECQCHYQGDNIQVLAIKLDIVDWRFPQENPIEEKRFILDKIGNEALDFLERKSVYAEKFICGEILYLVVEICRGDNCQNLYQMLFREVNLFMERYLYYSFSMGVGAEAKLPDTYTYAFKSARAVVYGRIREGVNKILFFSDGEECEINPEKNISCFIDRFRAIVETCNEMEVQTWIGETTKILLQRERGVYNLLVTLKTCLEKVLLLFYEKSEGEMELPAEKIKKYGEAIMEYTNEAWMIRFVKNTILECFERFLEFKRMQEVRPIREAKKYIDMHYQEDITLEKLAEKVYLNPVYFSTMFKNEAGMNFSKYLLKVRLDKAKEFLGSQEYTIVQIAQLVGYRDYKHFSKIFKKNVGITPNEYRKLNY